VWKIDPPPPTGFQELFRLHEGRLLAFIRRRLGRVLRRRLESVDVLQDVFLEALKLVDEGKADRQMDGRQFLVWASRIAENRIRYLARHHLTTQRRTVRREIPLDLQTGSLGPGARSRTPSEELSALEETQRIEAAVQRLPPREREVVILVHFERLKVSEAARKMKKTANSTSVLLHKAHERLAKLLDPE
jgi:RNA polymerase sigma-70 factor (ECF subfamily)